MTFQFIRIPSSSKAWKYRYHSYRLSPVFLKADFHARRTAIETLAVRMDIYILREAEWKFDRKISDSLEDLSDDDVARRARNGALPPSEPDRAVIAGREEEVERRLRSKRLRFSRG